MENVFEILKDLPKPGDYVLLTVAKGSAAGEKAITERLHSDPLLPVRAVL